jgi:hypothetical protein
MKRGRTCPCRNGDEYDVFTKWRRVISWGRGETRRIKKAYNRRARRLSRLGLYAEWFEST